MGLSGFPVEKFPGIFYVLVPFCPGPTGYPGRGAPGPVPVEGVAKAYPWSSMSDRRHPEQR